MRLRSLTIIAITCSLLLTGCGFKLRGSQVLPPSVNFVAIKAQQAHDPLARALERRLAVYSLDGGVDATSASPLSSVTVRVAPEKLERRLLSVFSTGQVAEYELIYGVNYMVQFAGKDATTHYFEVLRDYQDDPDQVLAKSRELELVLDEMRQEAADRIIRRLASQAAAAGITQ